MKRQLLNSLSMFVMITGAFAMAVVSANGQSTRVVAQVPFDFLVGDKAFPAGEYSVNSIIQDGSALLIRNAEATDSAMGLTNSIVANPHNSQSRLVFHRYGRTYFLAEVWRGGDSEGRRLIQSKQERAMKRELGASLTRSMYERLELVATLR
jgi:hypothetical protein